MAENSPTWTVDWAWGVPLIVVTLLMHAVGLLLVEAFVLRKLDRVLRGHRFRVRFPALVVAAVLPVTLLHGAEASVWALVYRMLGALPDFRAGVLYSLSAITSYGHANVFLQPNWQMLGALEALNGVMLFGLTTAFLFSVLQQVSSTRYGRKD